MDQMREWMVERFGNSQCESPMEALLRAGWELSGALRTITPDAKLKYAQQQPVGNYRADFLFSILDKDGSQKGLVVEVDGHDFHERTKAQAARDKARDRWMTSEGYQVMRFTGSEVYANPFKCAQEVANQLYQIRFGVTPQRARALAGIEAIYRILRDDAA